MELKRSDLEVGDVWFLGDNNHIEGVQREIAH